ncbi:MAG TPA: PH domain-containing protein [Acidimicrobiia bacterium]|jgi:hypothetical protein
MKVVYRYWLGNVALAAAVVGVALLFAVALVDGDGSQGPVMRWWSLPPAVLFVSLAVVRCLRWGVDVDDIGITKREPWATTVVPWTSLTEIQFLPGSRARLRGDGERTTYVTAVERGNQPSLQEVYARVRERWREVGAEARPYPGTKGRWLTLVFWGSAIAVVLGGLLWDDARHDADVYAARDRRDRDATATVADVRVTEHTSDADTSYTTHVDAWLRLPDEDAVLLKLERPGDVSYDYDNEMRIPVVYDSAHPRDADFADRPNRDANDDSVSLRSVTGPLLYWAGIVGAIVSGIVLSVEWRRRRPATRRTSPTRR